MPGTPRHWDDVSRLVRDVGREDHVAQRMQLERAARGWSQSELARQLAAIGYSWLDQPAISAIESPRAGASKRRSVRVDEALALSRVFDIPLAELLVPEDALEDIVVRRDFARGSEEYRTFQHTLGMYAAFLDRLAGQMTEQPRWDAEIDHELAGAEAEMTRIEQKYGGAANISTRQGNYWRAREQRQFLLHLKLVRDGADAWTVVRGG